MYKWKKRGGQKVSQSTVWHNSESAGVVWNTCKNGSLVYDMSHVCPKKAEKIRKNVPNVNTEYQH